MRLLCLATLTASLSSTASKSQSETERTLLFSRKSSSSCSRIEGVIRERIISERFSRLMNKKPPAFRPRAKAQQGESRRGRSPAGGWSSCAEKVRPENDAADPEEPFDLHRHFRRQLAVAVLPT